MFYGNSYNNHNSNYIQQPLRWRNNELNSSDCIYNNQRRHYYFFLLLLLISCIDILLCLFEYINSHSLLGIYSQYRSYKNNLYIKIYNIRNIIFLLIIFVFYLRVKFLISDKIQVEYSESVIFYVRGFFKFCMALQ